MTEPTRQERVLVTGVTGFIGSRVAVRWNSLGAEVRGLVREPVDLSGVHTVVGDMLDAPSLVRAVEGVDVVVHTAADFGSEVDLARRVNEEGTRALAVAALAAGCRRFVHLSSCGAYALEGIATREPRPAAPDVTASLTNWYSRGTLAGQIVAENPVLTHAPRGRPGPAPWRPA